MANIFDPTNPADAQAVKLGATRIRELKTILNNTLGKLYSLATTESQTPGDVSEVADSVSATMLWDESNDANDANRAVSSDHIRNDAITTLKILNAAVTAAKLATDAVETAKIKDANVTDIKLAEDARKGRYLRIIHQETADTDGGDFTKDDESPTTLYGRERTLNVSVTNDITGASLASNAITLPEGNYHCRIKAAAYRVGTHKAVLWNKSDGSVIKVGTSEQTQPGSNVQTWSEISGRFSIASGGKDVTIRHRCSDTRSGDGMGLGAAVPAGSSFSPAEVFCIVEIWKLD